MVHVVYAGSATEDFRLSDPKARHEVVFCEVADENGVPLAPSAQEPTGAAGAAGAADDSPRAVQSLYCRLFTAGFTQLIVSGSGFTTVKYDLALKDGECSVVKPFVLDSPDAGS